MVYNVGSTDDDSSLWVLLEQARDAILKVRQKELRGVGIPNYTKRPIVAFTPSTFTR